MMSTQSNASNVQTTAALVCFCAHSLQDILIKKLTEDKYEQWPKFRKVIKINTFFEFSFILGLSSLKIIKKTKPKANYKINTKGTTCVSFVSQFIISILWDSKKKLNLSKLLEILMSK